MTTIPLNEQSSSSSLVQDPSGTLPTTCNAPVISKSTCVPSDRDATIPAEVPQSSPDLKPHPDTCTSNSQLVGKWIDSVCNVTQTESQQTQEGDLVVVEDTHPTAYHPYCGHQTSATRDEVSSSISTCSSLPWMSRVRKSMLQTPKDGESASGKDNDDDDETNEDIDEMTSCASSSTTYSTAASSSQRAGSVASTTTHSTKSHALSPSDLVIDFEPIVLQGTRIDASVVQTEDEKVEMFRILRNSRSEHPVGVIYKVLSDVAVIRVLQGAPILDVGSVMCLESGMLLGRVTTLFGPIAACFYAVWLPNASEGLHDISFTTKADALIPGTSVFTLPDYNVVIASEEEIALCRKIPGTDASYVDDQELPEDMRPDFSDDEKEREWKHERKRRTTHRAAICGQGIIPNSTLRTPLCGEVSSVTGDDVSVEFDEDGEVKNLLVRSKRKGEKESPRERGGAEIYRFASTKMMSGKRGRTARGRGNFQ